ncbi:MAG: cation transporter [Caulobacteraceae bacterium]
MKGFRLAALIVALANLAYFGVEFAMALGIGSVSLFADSIDFLEDTAVNLLIVVALGWSARRRGAVGMALAAVLLAPALATLWMAWRKFTDPAPPAPEPLALTALGALAVNFGCALLLARHRGRHGSLSRAAFLSARNDVFANLAIIATGVATIFIRSGWPDLVVGLGIAAVNADAAREVLEAARKERLAPEP